MFPDDSEVLNNASLVVEGTENAFNGKAFLYDFEIEFSFLQ